MTSVVPSIGYCCLLLCSVPTMYCVLTIQNANLAMYIHHMPQLVLLNFAEFHIHLLTIIMHMHAYKLSIE